MWRDNYTDVHFIPQGLVEGKELVVDEWEVRIILYCFELE